VTWLAHLPIVSAEVTLPLIVPVTMYTLLCASLFLPEEKNSDV